jgi:hypothetical protein
LDGDRLGDLDGDRLGDSVSLDKDKPILYKYENDKRVSFKMYLIGGKTDCKYCDQAMEDLKDMDQVYTYFKWENMFGEEWRDIIYPTFNVKSVPIIFKCDVEEEDLFKDNFLDLLKTDKRITLIG